MRETVSAKSIMKGFLVAACYFFLMLVSPPQLLAGTPEKPVQNLSEIIQRGTLRVGLYYKDKPPFVMTRKDGSLYGLDIELANNIAQQLGTSVSFDRTSKSYSELISRVSTGKDFDVVICKMSSTMKRATKVRFTKPYLVFHQGLALNKKFITTNKIRKESPIADLKGMKFKVGARISTSYVEYARNLFPKAEIIEGGWDDLVEMLLKGEIDGLMRDEFTLMSLIRERPDIALHLNVYRIKDRTDPIAIATPQGDSMLQYWLDLYIAANHQEPLTSDALIAKYPELWQK
ncbi:MAG: amino acid ABC transporter substrate-binding protein [Pseudodesulfovibrio sp.]|nr:amino acid ABC transporter substrate-binding protein [Pseudodesulfovibrio sp.]